MKKILLPFIVLILAYAGLEFLGNKTQRDIEINELKHENETLKKALIQGNSKILEANRILAGDSAGTLLKGADGRVLYY